MAAGRQLLPVLFRLKTDASVLLRLAEAYKAPLGVQVNKPKFCRQSSIWTVSLLLIAASPLLCPCSLP